MTEYNLKHTGNCPIIDPSEGSAFSIELAICFERPINDFEVTMFAGQTNIIKSLTMELMKTGSDDFPNPLTTLKQRAQDTLKRIFITSATDINVGDKFYLEKEVAPDRAQPLTHEKNTELIAEVLSADVLSLNEDDGTTTLFNTKVFVNTGKEAKSMPSSIAENDNQESAPATTATIYQLFPKG